MILKRSEEGISVGDIYRLKIRKARSSKDRSRQSCSQLEGNVGISLGRYKP